MARREPQVYQVYIDEGKNLYIPLRGWAVLVITVITRKVFGISWEVFLWMIQRGEVRKF